jgi:glucose-1-phosphate thymidylyltransferase
MKTTKGIILAGGSGTRLYPITAIFSKQLQVVYDKPMIYYPLAILMLAGIKDIFIISTPNDTQNYIRLLGDGSRLGISLEYIVQEKPGGLAEAFIYGEKFIDNQQVSLILGDNIFYGKLDFFREALASNIGATIFGYRVNNPYDYGVVELGVDNKVISIEEKPKLPKSNLAIPGLYVFSPDVVQYSKNLKPSDRGELEITDVHKKYLSVGQLFVKVIGRGIAWLDTGTPESMLEAGNFISAVEKRQGRKIACLEEIALNQNFISFDEYLKTVNSLPSCSYKDYCLSVIEDNKII